MRSTFAGLNTMVRGIFAHQLMQDTTGHNIVNAGTEGYSRQRVNLTPTMSIQQTSALGYVEVGTGVDAMSITRARNIYADKQFRQETATENYLKAIQVNYDKLEAIFDDSAGTGIQNAMMQFYQSWVDLSANASTTANRINVVEQGKVVSDVFQYGTMQLQNQINATYDQIRVRLDEVNGLTDKIINVNQQIAAREVAGDNANDLRDQRDLLVDSLSEYMEVVVTELPDGKFTINSEGITLVNGVAKLTLSLSNGVASKEYDVDYGVTDYTIRVDQSDIVYKPTTGSLGGDMEAIAISKSYIDNIAAMSAFMLTTFNEQHKAGYGLTKSNSDADDSLYTGVNFFGDNDVMYIFKRDEFGHDYVLMYREYPDGSGEYRACTTDGTFQNKAGLAVTDGVDNVLSGSAIVNAMRVNARLYEADGSNLVAAKQTSDDDTADGRNAVLLSDLFNTSGSEHTGVVKEDDVDKYVKLLGLKGNYGSELRISDLYTQKNLDGSTEITRAIREVSLNAYYNSTMSRLGVDAETVDVRLETQDTVMTQINNWRDSEQGVDWNEELTNMLRFQKGFSACSRMLTAMDEMLDRLVNGTGVVGR